MTQSTDNKPQVVRPDYEEDDGSVAVESRPEKIKPPQMYQVLLLNDDFTPMEFVVFVITEFFGKDQETAVTIMLKIHSEGKGICGIFTHDVAATKVNTVIDAAKNVGHPLQALLEPIDS